MKIAEEGGLNQMLTIADEMGETLETLKLAVILCEMPLIQKWAFSRI